MPLASPTLEQIQNLGEHIQDQGKIAQLIQLRALSWLNQSEKRQAKTDQAERDWYEKQLGGDVKKDVADDEMETTILGDIVIHQPQPNQPIQYQQPPVQPMSNPTQPQAKSSLPAVALAALLSTVGGGLAGYYFGGKNQIDVPAFDDESVRIGLGRIEDYKQGGE